MSKYIESSSMTNDLGSSAHRYALASHDPDGVVRWSVGGEWSASLLDHSPTLMTGPEVDAFKVRHPNARIVDVIVYREACEVYSAGCNSVLDHSERSTPQTRQAAREAGIKALIRAGFPEDALNIVGPEHTEQAPAAMKLSNYTRQQLARIGELDAAIDSSADQGDDAFFAAVAAKDEYIDAEGIDRDQLEVTGREVKVHFTNIVWDTDGLVANLPTEAILEMADDADIDLEGADALSDKFGFCVKSFQTPREYYVWCDDDCQNKTSSLEEAKKWRDEFIAQGRASWIVGDNGTYITDGEVAIAEQPQG